MDDAERKELKFMISENLEAGQITSPSDPRLGMILKVMAAALHQDESELHLLALEAMQELR